MRMCVREWPYRTTRRLRLLLPAFGEPLAQFRNFRVQEDQTLTHVPHQYLAIPAYPQWTLHTAVRRQPSAYHAVHSLSLSHTLIMAMTSPITPFHHILRQKSKPPMPIMPRDLRLHVLASPANLDFSEVDLSPRTAAAEDRADNAGCGRLLGITILAGRRWWRAHGYDGCGW